MGTAPQTALLPFFLPRRRILGDDLAPPRQRYFIVIPAVLGLTGLLCWAIGDEIGLVLGSCVATAVAFQTLWEWLFRKAPTRFSALIAMAMLLGYGFGTLNTWATLRRGSSTLAEVMGLGPGLLAHGLGAVLISSAALYFLGEVFEKPVFGRDFRLFVDERTRALIYLGTLAMISAYLTHSTGIGGATAPGGHLSIFGSFLDWLYGPLTAIAVAAFVTAPRGSVKVLSGMSALILLLMLSFRGRRITIYTSVEIFLVLGLVGFQWRRNIFRKFLLVACLGAIVVVCSLTFMLLRIAGYAIRDSSQQVTVQKRLELAGKMVEKGGAYSLAAQQSQTNIQSRTFVLAFFANILDASTRRTPGLGFDAETQSWEAIPRILYPGKPSYLSEEEIVDQQFGFSYSDEANSILTAGATDFGFLGVIFYPLLMVLTLRIVYELATKCFGTIPLLFVALAFIFVSIQTETTLTEYFVTIRGGLLFGTLIALFLAFPRIRLRVSREGAV